MSEPIDIKQVIYALERQAAALDAQAEAMGMDYAAEFPAEDAERLREAKALLQAAKVEDPHAKHWTAIAAAAEAVSRAPTCSQADCTALCNALDRLSSATMGEAEDDMARLTWMQTRAAAIEWEHDGDGVRVTLPRRYGNPVRLEWCTSLRHAIDRARHAEAALCGSGARADR